MTSRVPMSAEQNVDVCAEEKLADATTAHESLKYQLLGPSLTKAGQDSVDQSKVSEIIYEASRGSKFFAHESQKDAALTEKTAALVARKQRLSATPSLLDAHTRRADVALAALELGRDLTQTIVHLDCDAFYAAVERLSHPELADDTIPFAVGGGVLTTCNYAARRFGVRSGMAGFVAKKLCPGLVLIGPDFAKYAAKAREVRAVLARYDARFESASIDEAYLNLTGYCAEHSLSPAEAVQRMREEVASETRITVSAGVAANARLAKISSNVNKPDGQFVVEPTSAASAAFVRDLPVRKVPGVGRVLERELLALGIRNVGDVYCHRGLLVPLLGEKTAEFLFSCHLGLGRTDISPAEERERKSVGTESTFPDESDPAALRARLRSTAEELEGDLRRNEVKGRTLVLKVKLHTYEILTRQVAPPRAICGAEDLYGYALPVLAKLEAEMPGMKLRLMGLRCTHLVSTRKPDAWAFFGFKPMRQAAKRERDEDQWEQWPDVRLGSAGDDVPGRSVMPSGELPSDGNGPLSANSSSKAYRVHGKLVLPNPAPPERGKEEQARWDCPICSRPQLADERRLNDHIDMCLSKQAIRETLQEQKDVAASLLPNVHDNGNNSRMMLMKKSWTAPISRGAMGGNGKKGKRKGRPVALMQKGGNPTQKKLCFG